MIGEIVKGSLMLAAAAVVVASQLWGQEIIPGPVGEVTSLGAAGLAFFLLWWIVVKQRPQEQLINDARIEAAEKRAHAHTEMVVSLVTARFDAAIERQHQDTADLAKSVCERFDAVVSQQHTDTVALGEAIKAVMTTMERHYASQKPMTAG